MKKIATIFIAAVLIICSGISAAAAGEDIQLKIDAPAYALKDEVITVTVSLEANRGYAGLMYELQYDNTQLQLLTAKFEGVFAGDGSNYGMLGMFNDDKTRAASLVMPSDESSASVTCTGPLATYTFKVLVDGVSKDETTKANISLVVKNAFDESVRDLSAGVLSPSTVEIKKRKLEVGDINGDDQITKEDANLIEEYLLGKSFPEEKILVMDINRDGKVTSWDSILLDRYLAGWDVLELN